MSHNAILVSGATGNQGGAVVAALSALNKPFDIYALTRDAASPSAQNLASKYSDLKIISGTFDSPAAIFEACRVPIYAVFAVQLPPGFPPSAETEERHGKALIDAAVAHGVKVYVQTSVDRGPKSDTNATRVPHFISKYNIEKHLELKAEESGGTMSFTILRPSSFMENFAGGFMTKVMATSMRDAFPAYQRIQLVSTKDIGWFAAQALTSPENNIYKNRAISLAGDELNYVEMETIYKQRTGESIPTTFGLVRWALFQLIKELPMTLECFSDDGFSADISALRKANPELTTFKMWIDQNKKQTS